MSDEEKQLVEKLGPESVLRARAAAAIATQCGDQIQNTVAENTLLAWRDLAVDLHACFVNEAETFAKEFPQANVQFVNGDQPTRKQMKVKNHESNK